MVVTALLILDIIMMLFLYLAGFMIIAFILFFIFRKKYTATVDTKFKKLSVLFLVLGCLAAVPVAFGLLFLFFPSLFT